MLLYPSSSQSPEPRSTPNFKQVALYFSAHWCPPCLGSQIFSCHWDSVLPGPDMFHVGKKMPYIYH